MPLFYLESCPATLWQMVENVGAAWCIQLHFAQAIL
jgi:hypothetical protein